MRSAPLLALLLSAAALAQSPPESVYPVIDPGARLEGKALVDALREGGFVLFMRHARQVNPQPEQCSRAALASQGQAQAAHVGGSLRKLGSPIGSVRASTLCRASITAALMEVGGVEETADLLPSIDAGIQAARRRQLAAAPKPGTNTLLVSHVQGGEQVIDRMQLELAEVIVFRPDGRGGSAAIARIRGEDWDKLPR